MKEKLRTWGAAALSVAAFLFVGMKAGLIGNSEEGLWSDYFDAVDQCLDSAGLHFPDDGLSLADVAAGETTAVAVDDCMVKVAASDQQFASLGIRSASEQLQELKDVGFAWWRCVENNGYQRTTAIPLSGPDGYPLRVTAGHFDVAGGEQELAEFYDVAATCGDRSVDSLRDSNGDLSRLKADGDVCVKHEHDEWEHSHGCFSADNYPE